MTTGRAYHSATLLPSGRVLLVGGYDVVGATTLSSAELYDPTSNAFGAAGDLTSPRDSHTATLLPGGFVLIAAGESDIAGNLSSAELYDPAVGAFSGTGNLPAVRKEHTATMILFGRVLIVGGADNVGGIVPTAAAIEGRARSSPPEVPSHLASSIPRPC